MIFIGTDIVKISRINEIINKKGIKFLSDIFTKSEQSYCNNKVSPSMHYGGKFAAKESVKKALLSYKEGSSIPLNAIEIKNSISGYPIVSLKIDFQSVFNIKVSISHIEEYAIAMAILEIK